jgi:8-oxo-dGTP diphosphatase
MGILVDTDTTQQDVAHRAAKLYRFDKKKYDQLAAKGFDFEV